MQNRKQSTNHHRFLLPSNDLKPYLDRFIKKLSIQGYTDLSIENYYNSIAHFSIWLQKKSIPLKKVNNTTIEKFAKHHCHCTCFSVKNKMSHRYVNRIRCFVSYLYEKKILIKKGSSKAPSPLIVKFIQFLHTLGLTPATIKIYEISISKLLPLLGNNPKKYNSKIVQNAAYKASKQYNLSALKRLLSTLRVYLRFLVVEGICHPHLDAAVPIVAHWRLSTLPKYITSSEVERVISSCNTHTKQGLRDQAILLLLARLGLRAGDIINMLINDINWTEGTIRVRGKGRKEVLLPLPQDVGNALLRYLKKARPPTTINYVFLCLNAPYRPFRFPNNISDIVRAGLSRAGITNPPSRGANLLRHSIATTMLQNGATLENVSAVLRHRSLDMTAYYAKVNVQMLMKIAQPWPEGAPC